MIKILSLVEKLGILCLPSAPINLDHERFAEYRDSEEHPADDPFENPPSHIARRRLADLPSDIPTILRYFLDGSRRTYKIGDVVVDARHYYPVIAGQVGVAVVVRGDDDRLSPVRQFCHIKNVLAFPDKVSRDDLANVQATVNEKSPVPFELLQYTVRAQRDPVDLGVARIMSEMHDLEIKIVQEMASCRLLSTERILVIDGPLRFKKKFDLVQFKNVIGLSKTFRPSFTLGKGRRQESVGAITSKLDFGERTIVFRTSEEEKTIGMWYLRIRQPELMSMPLEGVVKLECYAVDPSEKETGLDADRIDNISRFILQERNVTPYQSDGRWASHIYPIYMAETYLKTSFRSDTHFKALF